MEPINPELRKKAESLSPLERVVLKALAKAEGGMLHQRQLAVKLIGMELHHPYKQISDAVYTLEQRRLAVYNNYHETSMSLHGGTISAEGRKIVTLLENAGPPQEEPTQYLSGDQATFLNALVVAGGSKHLKSLAKDLNLSKSDRDEETLKTIALALESMELISSGIADNQPTLHYATAAIKDAGRKQLDEHNERIRVRSSGTGHAPDFNMNRNKDVNPIDHKKPMNKLGAPIVQPNRLVEQPTAPAAPPIVETTPVPPDAPIAPAVPAHLPAHSIINNYGTYISTARDYIGGDRRDVHAGENVGNIQSANRDLKIGAEKKKGWLDFLKAGIKWLFTSTWGIITTIASAGGLLLLIYYIKHRYGVDLQPPK